MNTSELADNQLTHVIGENNNGEEVVITLRKPLYPESFVRQQQAEIEALKTKAHEWYLIAMGKAQEK